MDKDIDYVVAVARYNSISKAAQYLYVSQPSLSHYIKMLEQRMGLQLFERTLEGVKLTDAGAEYLEYAEQIQSLYSELAERMRQRGGIHSSQINVCFPLSMNLDIIEIQKKFQEKYPQYQLNIICAKSRVAYEKVKTSSCIFAVGPEPPQEMQLHFDKCLDNILFLAVPRSCNLSSYAVSLPGVDYPALELEKIPELPMVLQADSTNTRYRINRVAEKYHLKMNSVMEVESTILAIMSVRQQMGCCFLGQSYRGFIHEEDPIQLYVIHAGNGAIEHGERGIISLPGRRFSEPEKYIYRLAMESMIEHQ